MVKRKRKSRRLGSAKDRVRYRVRGRVWVSVWDPARNRAGVSVGGRAWDSVWDRAWSRMRAWGLRWLGWVR